VADRHRGNERPFVGRPWRAHPYHANGRAIALTNFARNFPACWLDRTCLLACVRALLAGFICRRHSGLRDFCFGQRFRRRARHCIQRIGAGPGAGLRAGHEDGHIGRNAESRKGKNQRQPAEYSASGAYRAELGMQVVCEGHSNFLSSQSRRDY
jgi:hypothetical protein